jgi:DNA-binding Lrp family transcriptional regulator
VDVIDFAIYRHMFPGGQGRFWASRSMVDPRITPRQIGERVGLTDVAVRNRLARLRDEGFIQGHEVWPHPGLLGASLRVAEIPLKKLADADRVVSGLERIVGVISARIMVDEDNRSVRVSYVEDSPDLTNARSRDLAALAGAEGPISSRPEWLPPSPTMLSALGWRVLLELRSEPELSLKDHAQRLGISLKTVTRWFNELLDQNAVFWVLQSDSSLLSVAAYFVWLRDPSVRSAVCGRIEERIGAWLPIVPGGLGEPPEPPPPWVAGMFWVRAPAESETLSRTLLSIEGVQSVQRRFPSNVVSFQGWFDRRLNEQVRKLGLPSKADA